MLVSTDRSKRRSAQTAHDIGESLMSRHEMLNKLIEASGSFVRAIAPAPDRGIDRVRV